MNSCTVKYLNFTRSTTNLRRSGRFYSGLSSALQFVSKFNCDGTIKFGGRLKTFIKPSRKKTL